MKRLLKIFLSLTLVAGVSSCDFETIVEVEIPNGGPQLVVNSVLSPDQPVRVSVTESRHILDERYDFQIVTTAKVVLTGSNGVTRELTFDPADDHYWLPDFTVSQGVNYSLTVEAANFKTTTTEGFINPAVEILQIEKGGKGMIEEEFTGRIFYLHFQDDPAKRNFYRVRVEEVYAIYSNDPSIDNDYRDTDKLLFDDALFNGRDASFAVIIPEYESEASTLTFVLEHLSEDYYKYIETSTLQRYVSGDPFAQPVTVHNNIRNGLGIFGTMSLAKKDFVQ
jgi:hypothetical protein